MCLCGSLLLCIPVVAGGNALFIVCGLVNKDMAHGMSNASSVHWQLAFVTLWQEQLSLERKKERKKERKRDELRGWREE